eukprot:6479712-Amphidinium_carterae.1
MCLKRERSNHGASRCAFGESSQHFQACKTCKVKQEHAKTEKRGNGAARSSALPRMIMRSDMKIARLPENKNVVDGFSPLVVVRMVTNHEMVCVCVCVAPAFLSFPSPPSSMTGCIVACCNLCMPGNAG